MTQQYEATVTWTGNQGTGTSDYRAYRRDHEVTAPGRPPIPASSDPAHRGDPNRWNPEQLLLAALAQCHMLWYLHLCADHGITVTHYTDTATATGTADRFTEATLHPRVTVTDPAHTEAAGRLHAQAHAACYIANSVAFPVHHRPTVTT
jgi:organic hydroperoxide reductase OsmC/OhrA